MGASTGEIRVWLGFVYAVWGGVADGGVELLKEVDLLKGAPSLCFRDVLFMWSGVLWW